AHARALNETYMPCQMLGELGSAYLETGQRDRGLDCYEEGLRIATHCRFPDQMVRLLMFCAHYYVGQGRPALAMNLMHEAQRVSRELGGGTDLRLAVESTGVFSGLECWDAVDRLVDRVDFLLHDRDHETEPPMSHQILGILRAQTLMAHGEVDT